ncbi:MAG: DUF5615 family PIN-like protein [Hyphomicrobium aestuarii]|nr:DUF5615 family PIN-like protein [Hyphomicrobium aestuarii]
MVGYLADECLAGPLVVALIEAGFDVKRSAETIPSAPDESVLALAFAERRILLTEDTDFGDLTIRFGLATHGVVRVDLKGLDRSARATRLIGALTELGAQVEGAFVTIEATRTRVRRLTR